MEPPELASPIGFAHLTSVAEFRELLISHFEQLALIETESFAAPRREYEADIYFWSNGRFRQEPVGD